MTQFAKPPIEPAQFARNGKYPDAFFQAELSDRCNRLALYRLKQLASFACHAQNIPGTFGDTERKRWRFRFVSSPYAAGVVIQAWMIQRPPEGTSSRPRVRLRIADDGGSTQGDAELQFGAAPTSVTDAPNACAVMWSNVASSGTTMWVPTPNTAYQGTISDFDNGTVVAATVFEISNNAAAPFNANHSLGTPILDLHRHELTAGTGASANGGLRQMWKTQAAPLFHWSMQTTARTRTSATNVNVIDNSTTTVGTSSPGFTIDLRNRSTLRRVTVPVAFYAYGTSAGTGGVVQLRDSTNTVVASLTGITTEGWYSTTANLPATLAKYDIYFSGDGTNSFSFYGCSLYQHATGS